MAKNAFKWWDDSWNPVSGCTKVSDGCKHCYAERDWGRLVHLPAYAGRKFTDVACHFERLDQPLHWKKPRRVFVNSMSDLFHPDVSDEFIARVFAVMGNANHHTYLVLTKRPQRMKEWFSKLQNHHGMVVLPTTSEKSQHSRCDAICVGLESDWPLKNLWLGVSAENQQSAIERIPLLLQTPAVVRWASAEPLLGAIDLTDLPVGEFERWNALEEPVPNFPRLNWVVVGGESGANARPMHNRWARSLRDQCKAAGVSFLFKQWGEFAPWTPEFPVIGVRHVSARDGKSGRNPGYVDGESAIRIDTEPMAPVGKKIAGRLLDGVEHNGMPAAEFAPSRESEIEFAASAAC